MSGQTWDWLHDQMKAEQKQKMNKMQKKHQWLMKKLADEAIAAATVAVVPDQGHSDLKAKKKTSEGSGMNSYKVK